MLRLTKLLLPGILLGLMTSCVLADGPTPLPGAPTAGAEVKPGAPLTDEILLQMLRGLGYEPGKITPLSDGRKMYEVCVKRDGWTIYLTVLLSPDRSVVWIESYLGRVPADDKIMAEALLKIVKLNAQVGTAKFVITPSGELWLWMPVSNHGITPNHLRTALDYMVGHVKDTVAFWKTGVWTAEGKAAFAFRDKIDTLHGKVREAFQEFLRELNPVSDGRPVDRSRLKKAHEKLLQTVRTVRESMKALDVPNAPVVRELLDAYLRLLEADEAFFTNELAEVVALIEDGKVAPADVVTKINQLLGQLAKKEEAAVKAYRLAYENFRKQYDA